MRVTCAWCGKDLGEKPPLEDKSITHGMCRECLEKELKKAEDKGDGKE